MINFTNDMFNARPIQKEWTTWKLPEFSKNIFIYVKLGFANATPTLFHVPFKV